MDQPDWRLKELMKAFHEMDTDEKMKNFLEGILTPKELEEIPTRLQIVKMLKEGTPQHEIAGKLKIGIATVTRGSKEIQKGNFKYV
ncbi:MAG: transcriptional regulator [Candidatus Levybacteria bacterium]|nr:transcriptional regulator [Candidatus Levybacteria bacterium]